MVNMDSILNANIKGKNNVVEVTFRKTIQKRQYEPETIEVSTSMVLEDDVSGPERALITAVLQSQVEYSAMVNLVFKGSITEKELADRREELESCVNSLKNKAEALTGKEMDKWFP